MHTIEEESMPPLSSARTGLSERRPPPYGPRKIPARKCSSYSASVSVADLLAGIKVPILACLFWLSNAPGIRNEEGRKRNGSDVWS